MNYNKGFKIKNKNLYYFKDKLKVFYNKRTLRKSQKLKIENLITQRWELKKSWYFLISKFLIKPS